MLNMNQTNINAIADHNFVEVTEITCECCGKKAIVAHLENLCTHCQLEQQETVNGTLYSEDYAEWLAAGIGKEEVNTDKLIWRLLEGHKLVIRCFSKVHGYSWKAAKMFEKQFKFARQFENREHAERVAAKYQGQVTTRIMTLNEVMDLGLIN